MFEEIVEANMSYITSNKIRQLNLVKILLSQVMSERMNLVMEDMSAQIISSIENMKLYEMRPDMQAIMAMMEEVRVKSFVMMLISIFSLV